MKRVGFIIGVAWFCSLLGCQDDAERAKEYTAFCHEGTACKEQGLCTGQCKDAKCKCIAGTDQDCASIDRCKTLGHCSAVNGECLARSDEDCKKASGCEAVGKCTAKEGHCIAGSAEGCKQSEICRKDGKCSLSTDRCVVASNADCRESHLCQLRRKCEAVEGECVLASKAPAEPPEDVARAPADAERTSSGLASKVLEKGVGKNHPKPEDRVLVLFTGWTTNGKKFADSFSGGQPHSTVLSSAIPGWTEGVGLMVEGEKRRFWIPQNLAYKGREPFGTLVFDIELVEIVK